MTFPIAVEQFAQIIPHRPPMVWVDEVVSATESGGTCRVYLRSDALYMRQGRLLKTAPIEWMAQTFAFAQAAYRRHQNPVKEAFLVSVRGAHHLAEPGSMERHKSLLVHVGGYRDLGPIVLFDGEVRDETGLALARASLRIYRN